MTKSALANLRECWRERIAEFRASGQSGAAWCAAHQIKESQLWYWARKFPSGNHPKESSPSWIPVQIRESTVEVSEPLVVRVGQAAIEVRSGFDAGLLRDVIRTLVTVC